MPFQRPTLRGMCCQCFVLPYSPEEIWETYQHYVMDRGLYPDANGHSSVVDIEILAPMLNYVGYRPLTYAYPDLEGISDANKLMHMYTCKHFDYENGMCKIHEKRPNVCRIYKRCEHEKYCESWYCKYHPKHHRALAIEMCNLNLEEKVMLIDKPKLTFGSHNINDRKHATNAKCKISEERAVLTCTQEEERGHEKRKLAGWSIDP